MKISLSAKLGLMVVLVVEMMCSAAAQQAPQLTVHTVKEGKIYWVAGGGGNSGVIIGDEGVVVVDAKIRPDAGQQLVAEVAKLTSKPIAHVIMTHSDGDHVNGIVGFPDGLQIIAHANNKMEQQATFLFAVVEIDGGRCLPPAGRQPNSIVLKNRVETTLVGERFVFHHFGPAHTSGDLVVYLPDHKIAFVGDLITSTVLVHPEKGGSFEGWFRSADALLELDAEYYLGGHARELDTKASLRDRIQSYQDIRNKVDGLIAEGKSLPEIKTAMGDPPQNPSGCRGIPYPSLSEVEYAERMNKIQELK